MTKTEKQQRILNTTKAIFMDGKERNKCIKNFNGDFKGIKSQTYPPFWLWSTGPLQQTDMFATFCSLFFTSNLYLVGSWGHSGITWKMVKILTLFAVLKYLVI